MLNLFEGMTKREIMIEIGQISGDEAWENDIFFNISLELIGNQSRKLADTILLDFKDKINFDFNFHQAKTSFPIGRPINQIISTANKIIPNNLNAKK